MNGRGIGLIYHGGRGSLLFILPTNEPREWVSWTSRWRVCSRTLSWSWVNVAIAADMAAGVGWESQ